MARVAPIFFILILMTRSEGLQLLDIRVPQWGDLRGAVTMACDFKLEVINLYSVKWYKNDFEFFRYIPDNSPPTQSLPVAGISLDLSASNMTTITLVGLTFNSSGIYRCEVSTEGPNFKTVVGSGNMTVRALPVGDPLIEGVQPSYSVGEYISANCTSRPSYPPAELAWYINGIKVDKWFAAYWPDDGRPGDTDGLRGRSLSLRHQVQRQHGAARQLELRCAATVAGETRHRVARPALRPAAADHQLAQERLANSAVDSIGSARTICFVTTVALLVTS